MEIVKGFNVGMDELSGNFREQTTGGNGMFHAGKEGVKSILSPLDNKADFIIYSLYCSLYSYIIVYSF